MITSTPRYDVRTFLISVDSYHHGTPVGRCHSPYHIKTEAFESLSQLLLIIDNLLNLENIPQSYQQIRTFGDNSISQSEQISLPHLRPGKLATFTIRIHFRCNSSWQGTLAWMNKKQVQNFRSVLELIFLLDSALAENESTAVPAV